MTLSDKLADFFLLFNHQIIIIPLIILGFIVFKRAVFGHAFYLLLLTMIFNPLLKSIFQIPLSPSLGKTGFAFPSGHMQASVAFYGWLIYTLPFLSLRILLLFLLTGIGWALVHFDYHHWMDVFGAVGFALFTLASYKGVTRYFVFLQKQPSLTGLFLLPIVILMLVYLHFTAEIPAHAWMAFYALAGFTSSWILARQSLQDGRWKEKAFALCLCVFGMIFTYCLFHRTPLKALPLYLFQSQWFVVASLVPISVKIAQRKIR